MKDQLKFFTDSSELIFEVNDESKELFIESKCNESELSYIFNSDDVAVLVAVLLDLEPETIKTIPFDSYNFLVETVSFLDSDIPEILPDFAENLNIAFASVGQLEKANELLKLYPLWEAAPFLYAIYENKNY